MEASMSMGDGTLMARGLGRLWVPASCFFPLESIGEARR